MLDALLPGRELARPLGGGVWGPRAASEREEGWAELSTGTCAGFLGVRWRGTQVSCNLGPRTGPAGHTGGAGQKSPLSTASVTHRVWVTYTVTQRWQTAALGESYLMMQVPSLESHFFNFRIFDVSDDRS